MKEFLMNNFIYFAIAIAFIILALIGYMLDKVKTNKIKNEYDKKMEEQHLSIPISNASNTSPVVNTELSMNNSIEKSN